jgi:hypothetical protein
VSRSSSELADARPQRVFSALAVCVYGVGVGGGGGGVVTGIGWVLYSVPAVARRLSQLPRNQNITVHLGEMQPGAVRCMLLAFCRRSPASLVGRYLGGDPCKFLHAGRTRAPPYARARG